MVQQNVVIAIIVLSLFVVLALVGYGIYAVQNRKPDSVSKSSPVPVETPVPVPKPVSALKRSSPSDEKTGDSCPVFTKTSSGLRGIVVSESVANKKMRTRSVRFKLTTADGVDEEVIVPPWPDPEAVVPPEPDLTGKRTISGQLRYEDERDTWF
ncbi:hypothetical protein B0A52_06960 [Exophiala mesophila]|uniref:Uncharacterized protein n=1 Tax=Exophiala mesophila TaxID=212818 RepID=A0A438N0V8_EXOME|nr:hypothetical protein B0A52_06960 [Exophiala mesophila]